MKHQYFGDVNDFRKYGLLRILTGNGTKRLGIFWMLTEDDGRSDGNFTRYLSDRDRWRSNDPELFDTLASAVIGAQRRTIAEPVLERLIPNTIFVSDMMSNSAEPRRRVIHQAIARFAGRDLIFLDPDNGFEVTSVRRGSKGSNKYIYWDELTEFSRTGASLLVYQHFPREQRSSFTPALATKMCEATHANEVHTFSTSHVLFLLAPRPGEEEWYREQGKTVEKSWALHFTRVAHISPTSTG